MIRTRHARRIRRGVTLGRLVLAAVGLTATYPGPIATLGLLVVGRRATAQASADRLTEAAYFHTLERSHPDTSTTEGETR